LVIDFFQVVLPHILKYQCTLDNFFLKLLILLRFNPKSDYFMTIGDIIFAAGGARPLRGQHGDGNNPNSLSQWFSGAGQMGAMPPIPTANTFSVEELERRQQTSTATPVHN
jgi:hypothetical protein